VRCECLTRIVDAWSLSKKECCVVMLVDWSRLQQPTARGCGPSQQHKRCTLQATHRSCQPACL
jgi:hypothetical protein